MNRHSVTNYSRLTEEEWCDFEIEMDNSKFNCGVPKVAGSLRYLMPPGTYKGPVAKELETDYKWLLDWLHKHHLYDKEDPKGEQYAAGCIGMAHYLCPDINEDQIKNLIMFNGWVLFQDDVVDFLSEEVGGEGIISAGYKVLLDIFHDKFGHQADQFINWTAVPGFPKMFPRLEGQCNAVMEIHISMCKTVPNYFMENSSFLESIMLRLKPDPKLSMKYSKETLRHLFRYSVGFQCWTEFMLLNVGIRIPRLVKKDPFMQRLRIMVLDAKRVINEIMGIRRDWKNGVRDGLILLQYHEEKIPITVAMAEAVEWWNICVSDIRHLIEDLISNRFPGDPDLIAATKFLEVACHGYMVWCSTSPRYAEGTKVRNRIEKVKL